MENLGPVLSYATFSRERIRIKRGTPFYNATRSYPNQLLTDSWAVGSRRGRPMERFGLRNDQWERIKDVLPGREGHVGGTAEDNRLFVEAVLYRFRTGCPWRDLPARLAYWSAVPPRVC